MTTLFLTCAALGALVLILQTVLSLVGLDHGAEHGSGGAHVGDAGLGEGLELLSVRSLAAGVAFFGLGGLWALSRGLPGPVAAVAGLVPGAVALVGTAALMRQVLRVQTDGSLQLSRAVGGSATVYLPIPAAQGGPGKVHLVLQGRTVELQAVTPAEFAIPTGTPVVVVSVVDSDTVEVVPTSIVEEALDDRS